MSENEGNVRTISQQKLEQYINDQEDLGQLLVDLGAISPEEYAASVHKMEDFRVKIEADPDLAEQKASEADETGIVAEIEDAETGG